MNIRRASVVLLLAWGVVLASETPQAPDRAAVKGADLALLQSVRAVAARVEELRDQRFFREPLAVRAPDVMREVAADIRAFNVLTSERLEARGRAWDDVGLAAPSSPGVLFRALARDLAGIGFDPEGNRLLVSPDRLTSSDFAPKEESDPASTVLMMTGVRLDEPLVAHLLMHVRQRERAGGDSLKTTTDALLASSVWAEGEANLVAVRFLFGGLGLENDVLDSPLDPGELLGGQLYPPTLAQLAGSERAMVDFVYREGFAQAIVAFRAGGWAALDAAMTRTSTRDILHPERAGQAAGEILTPPAPIDGMQLADRDTLGEQAIVVLVSQQTGKDNLGLMGGDGWVADALLRWEWPDRSSGEGITQWLTRWNSQEEAADFTYAFKRSLKARFPEFAVLEESEQHRFELGGRVYRVRSEGSQVRIRVAAPSIDARAAAFDPAPETP